MLLTDRVLRRLRHARHQLRAGAAITQDRRDLAAPTSSSPASRPSMATPPRSARASPSASACSSSPMCAKIDDLDMQDRRSPCERRSEGGAQVLKTQLPCLMTMLEGINEMRRGTMDDALARGARDIVTVERQGRRHRGSDQMRPAGLPDRRQQGFRAAGAGREGRAHRNPARPRTIAVDALSKIFTRQPAIQPILRAAAS